MKVRWPYKLPIPHFPKLKVVSYTVQNQSYQYLLTVIFASFSFYHIQSLCFPWQIIKMYSFLDYIMGGCQIQFTVSYIMYNLLNIYSSMRLSLLCPLMLCERISVLGGNRLHSVQRGSQKQLLPALHPPLPAQRVSQSAGGCRGDLPRLWQVGLAPLIIV